MATTVATYPGSTSAIARTSATTWTNTGNIVSDNTTDATCNNTTGNGSYYLVASNFGFAIPTGRIITGVTVVVQASEHTAGTEVLYAQLQNDSGTLFGGSKTATINGTTKVNYTYGSRTDLWAAALTADIVNDADFGVRVWFTTSHDIRIDFIRMTVEYGDEVALAAPSDLTVAGYAPSLSYESIVTPGVGELTLVGYDPTVARTSEDVRVSYARLSILTTDVRVSYARLDTADTTNIVLGVGGLTVSSDPVSLYQTTNRNIVPGVGEVIVSGNIPQVFLGDFITIGAASLPSLGFSPTVVRTENRFISPGLGELTVVGNTPNLQGNYNLSPDVGALTVEGFTPLVGQDKQVTLGVGQTTIQGFSPFLVNGITDVRFSYARMDTQLGSRTFGTASLTVVGYSPAIGALILGGGGYRELTWEAVGDPGVNGYWIYWDVSSRGDDNYQDYKYSTWVSGRTTTSYIVSGLVPFQMYYFNMSSDGGSGTHTIYESELVGEFSAEALDGNLLAAGHAPVITQTRNVFKTPGAGALTVAGLSPGLDYGIPTQIGALTVSGESPTVEQTRNVFISNGVGSVQVVGHAPTLKEETSYAPVPDTGVLTLVGYRPTVVRTLGITFGYGELIVFGEVPTIAVTTTSAIYPETGSLSVEGFAPTVSQTANMWATLDVATEGTFEGFPVTLLMSGAFSITVPIGQLTVTGNQPDAYRSRYIDILQGDLTVQGYEPTVTQIKYGSYDILIGSAATTLAGYAASTQIRPTLSCELVNRLLSNRQELDPTTGKFRVYNDDDTTVLVEADAYENTEGSQRFRGGKLYRIDKLVVSE